MISRRLLLSGSVAGLWSGAALGQVRVVAPAGAYPFTLGVASGSPREDGVVLWTRLAPDPLRGGGMPVGEVAVRYRVCSDSAMRKTVAEGSTLTSDAKGHSVHVVQRGLKPGREYWYQFAYGGADSPVGRTRTADAKAGRVKLALASCNSYEAGHFAAFRDMAEWSPDCVIHVGDYIYEGGANPVGTRAIKMRDEAVTLEVLRSHDGPEIVSLWQYRNRYALYKADPLLQAAHAAAPWIVAMDDHEIDNNWAADTPEDPWAQTPLEFKVRKLAALQAFYEHMPIEAPPTLSGVDSHLQMYSQYRFGPANVFLLDTRQYRSDQVCEQTFPSAPSCPALNDPTLTVTGREQEAWLVHAMRTSTTPFNILASQMWFAPYRYNAGTGAPDVNMDQWDGYAHQRQRIIDAMAAGVSNPVVLSGDWHCAAAMRIHADPWNAGSRRIGHNFAGTSISSHCPWWSQLDGAKDYNPHVDYVNGAQRGYFRCDVNAGDLVGQFRVVADPRDPQSAVSTDKEIRTTDV